jgi:hypothetical protein
MIQSHLQLQPERLSAAAQVFSGWLSRRCGIKPVRDGDADSKTIGGRHYQLSILQGYTLGIDSKSLWQREHDHVLGHLYIKLIVDTLAMFLFVEV